MHECTTWRLKGLFRPERAFRPGVHQHRDKSGRPSLIDPALEGYRELFRTQFAREHRILDAGPTGLDLGLTRITPEAAAAMLMEEKKSTADSPLRATINGERERPRASGLEIGDFIKTEQKTLERLRNILSGREQALNDELVTLLDALDYLWAHFAEYQGTRSTAELSADRSFLKRVRAGIDRSLKDWTIATEVLDSFQDSGQAREKS